MKFWKMNGAGNDFLIINNIEEKIPHEKFPEIAKILCERRLSIGADGLMVVEKPEKIPGADYRMLFFNSDGSMGEMCGNGARCISRYGYENGLAGEIQKIETTAGLVKGRRICNRLYQVRLNDPCNMRLDEEVEVLGKKLICSYIELGDPGIPHVAVEMKNLRDYDQQELFNLGRALRYYEGYPKGANVNFYEIESPDHIYERTYERGVEDFTYACGTGTGSVITILTLQGRVSGKGVAADMKGGRLIVDVQRDGEKVKDLLLTGPTNIVAKGEVWDETLRL